MNLKSRLTCEQRSREAGDLGVLSILITNAKRLATIHRENKMEIEDGVNQHSFLLPALT